MMRASDDAFPPETGRAGGSLADFLRRAAQRLSREPPPCYSADAFQSTNGDHALHPDKDVLIPTAEPRHAAVLVPVIARPEPTVLLTLRAPDLSRHAGQVAFPGGRVDPEDRDEVDTALREAREEVGLDRGLVRPLGFLDGYLSSTGFWIVPVVGIVDTRYELHLNRAEVAEAFEVPLAFLMSPANHLRQSDGKDGRLRHFFVMPFENHNIWGATAGMLRNLYEKVYA